jgi:hypothetical protein
VTLSVDPDATTIPQRLALLTYEFVKECQAATLVRVVEFDVRGGHIEFIVRDEPAPRRPRRGARSTSTRRDGAH